MTTSSHPRVAALSRLHAQVCEALAMSDALELHPTGIALDTARLSIEDELAASTGADASVSATTAPWSATGGSGPVPRELG